MDTWICGMESNDGVASIRNGDCIFLHSSVQLSWKFTLLVHIYNLFNSNSGTIYLFNIFSINFLCLKEIDIVM